MPLLPEKAVRSALREHARRNGKRIQTRRKMLGLTQEQVAEMAGLTQKAVSHYELGVREPRDHHRVMLAAALGCAVEDLFASPDRVEIATLVLDRGDAA